VAERNGKEGSLSGGLGRGGQCDFRLILGYLERV
jgi:hypothetical protein